MVQNICRYPHLKLCPVWGGGKGIIFFLACDLSSGCIFLLALGPLSCPWAACPHLFTPCHQASLWSARLSKKYTLCTQVSSSYIFLFAPVTFTMTSMPDILACSWPFSAGLNSKWPVAYSVFASDLTWLLSLGCLPLLFTPCHQASLWSGLHTCLPAFLLHLKYKNILRLERGECCLQAVCIYSEQTCDLASGHILATCFPTSPLQL